MENIMQLINTDWWKAASMRAIKTVAQTAVATYGTMNLISTVEDAKTIVLTSLFAGVLSILTSIAIDSDSAILFQVLSMNAYIAEPTVLSTN
jgi:hypothetical protein